MEEVMKKILNPNKLIRNDVKCPTIDDLIKAKELICLVLGDCRFQIKKFLNSKELINYGRFIAVSCDSIFNNLNAVSRLGSNYLNQIFTLSRNFHEIVIDNLWMYSFYEEDPEIAEEIAERFFVFSRKSNIQYLKETLPILDIDIFLRDVDKQILLNKIEKSQKYIQDYKFYGNKKLIYNWRAHPKYFKSLKDVDWRHKSKIAKEISEKLVNFKNAPYLENLKYLSAYNHWDPIQTNILNDTNNNRFYARTLNLLLCISLDFLNLQYRIRGIDKSRPSNFIKAVNLIFYSSQ